MANQDVDQRNTYGLFNTSAEQIFCSPFQTSHIQADRFPRLNASPGSQIAAQYLENGHVSAPESVLSAVGDITWFGIESNDVFGADLRTFGEILNWQNNVGEGSSEYNARLLDSPLIEFVVLGVTPFDDGICGRGDPALPCRSSFQIPSDATVGSVYTVYWLWDYSGKLGPNTGHVEACILLRPGTVHFY